MITLERVRLFYAGLGFAGLATLLLAGLVYWLNGRVGSGPIGVLSGGLLLVGVAHLGLWYAWYRCKPEIAGISSWVYFPLPATLLSGLLWGAITAYVLPLQQTDAGLLILLAIGASTLLSIMLSSALELTLLLFIAGFLAALLWVFTASRFWPSGASISVLLAVVLGLGLVAMAFSVLFGIIARLRAGKQNVSGKLNLARRKMDGLHSRLSDQDERRRDVEQKLYLAKEAAETANMVKSEFLAIMSHEIRTPLNGIVPLLEILRETTLNREQRQIVATALNSSHHLLSIINDILDFSKIEAGKLDLESIELNLRELVESVVAMMAKSAERRGLELDYRVAADLPAVVRGDPIRLRQVLTNLVSNAIKFTPRGSVVVEAACRGRGRKHVEVIFTIRDSGVGISEEIQARLFRSFNQADASTTRKHGGTGLGLVISRRLVELMDGKIGVRSEVGKGSVFWFVVPLRKSLRDMPAERRSLQGLRVLVLDDNDRHAEKIGQYLAEWGVLYQGADGTMDALAKLVSTASLGESWAYELLVIDSKSLGGRLQGFLQELNGEAVLAGLKRLAIGQTPRSATRLGLDATLGRPVKKSDLYRALCRVMDVQSEAGASREQGEEKLANQFFYADGQGQSWAETVPVESIAAEMPSADEIQLMGHVLIVEDNLINLNVAKKMLLRLGLTCDVAADGLAALRAIDQQHYDLILMDCQMPRMDGYEATRAIRLREVTRGLARLPVIAMTANAMEGDCEKCLEAGMDDYLSKPVMPATLRLMLSRWLPRSEPEARAAESREIEPDPRIGKRSAAASIHAADGDRSEIEVDRAVLEELYEIMVDDFSDLLISYLDAAPGLIREIEAGILDGDTQQVILPAHSLKSSSANVGAMKLSALARRMELAARQGDLAAVTGAFEQLNQSFDAAGSVLREACEQGLS